MAKHPIIDHLDRHTEEVRKLYMRLDAWISGFETARNEPAPEIIKAASEALSHRTMAAYATIRELVDKVNRLESKCSGDQAP